MAVRNEATPVVVIGQTVEDVKKLESDRDAAEKLMNSLEDIEVETGLDEDQQTQYTNAVQNFDKLNKRIDIANRRASRTNSKSTSKLDLFGRMNNTPKKTDPVNVVEGEKPGEVKVVKEEDPTDKWRNSGEMLRDIQTLYTKNEASDGIKHLMNKEGAYSQEHGFLLPTNLSNRLLTNDCRSGAGTHTKQSPGMQAAAPAATVLPMQQGPMWDNAELGAALQTMPIPMQSPFIKMPYLVDKDHRSGVFGGIIATNKPDEACMKRLSEMKLGKCEMEVGGSYVLAKFHQLLLRDSPLALETLFRAGATQAFMNLKIENILYGSETGHYQGILDDKVNPALIEICRRGPKSIHYQDILEMRKVAMGFNQMFWLTSTTGLCQLITLNKSLKTCGEDSIFQYNPLTNTGVLLGRPVIVSDDSAECDCLALINPSYYYEGTFQDEEFGENPWLMWLCDETLFKVTKRNVGKIGMECPVIPAKCPTPKSAFVKLSDRDRVPNCDGYDFEVNELFYCNGEVIQKDCDAQATVSTQSKPSKVAPKASKSDKSDK